MSLGAILCTTSPSLSTRAIMPNVDLLRDIYSRAIRKQCAATASPSPPHLSAHISLSLSPSPSPSGSLSASILVLNIWYYVFVQEEKAPSIDTLHRIEQVMYITLLGVRFSSHSESVIQALIPRGARCRLKASYIATKTKHRGANRKRVSEWLELQLGNVSSRRRFFPQMSNEVKEANIDARKNPKFNGFLRYINPTSQHL